MNILARLFNRKQPAPAPAPRVEPTPNEPAPQQKRSIFAGAEQTRLTFDWVVSSLSADGELRSGNLQLLKNRARELQRNNAIIRHYLYLATTNVIGADGMRIQGQLTQVDGTLDPVRNAALERAWNTWSESVSTCGRLSRVQFEKLALKTLATDGEVFIQKVNVDAEHNRYGFAMRIIDTDQVDMDYNRPAGRGGRGERVNEVRMGVELDELGKPVAFYVWTAHPTDNTAVNRERIRIDASEIIHVYDPERAGQTRGYSWLNSVMGPLKMLEGYQESELVASRINSSKMGFLRYTDAAAAQLEVQATPLYYEAEAGSLQMLPPGVEFQEWNPTHPNNAYDAYTKGVLREVAAGLGVSYNALANDLEKVNYSSLRSGMLMERDQWRSLQHLFIAKVYRPVFTAWAERAALSPEWPEELDRFTDYSGAARFIPRGWDWVDPLKDADASIKAIDAGLKSYTEVLAEKGVDFESVVAQRVREKQILEAAGLTAADLAATGATQQAAQPPAIDQEAEAE